jgi:hypothetical protein
MVQKKEYENDSLLHHSSNNLSAWSVGPGKIGKLISIGRRTFVIIKNIKPPPIGVFFV